MRVSIAHLRAAGLSAEQIVKVLEEADAERREKIRIIKRNQRARSVDRVDAVDSVASLPSIERPTLSQEERSEIVALEREWLEFYAAYPNKVGKPKAKIAFMRARKRATFEIITAGLTCYRAKTDDRPWCNPATWLNQDRWDDQPGPAQEGNGKARPAPQKASVLDFAAGFDARTRMQLAERAEIERQRRR